MENQLKNIAEFITAKKDKNNRLHKLTLNIKVLLRLQKFKKIKAVSYTANADTETYFSGRREEPNKLQTDLQFNKIKFSIRLKMKFWMLKKQTKLQLCSLLTVRRFWNPFQTRKQEYPLWDMKSGNSFRAAGERNSWVKNCKNLRNSWDDISTSTK